MDTKRKLFFAVISMILLSATALAVPVADHKSEIPHVVTNIKTPNAAFFIIPSSTTPLTINFIDQSTGSPTSWAWNFGEKSTSTAQNPIHTYCRAKKYTVKLKVKNAVGSNTVTKIIGFSVKDNLTQFSTSPTGSDNHLSPLRFQSFNRKVF